MPEKDRSSDAHIAGVWHDPRTGEAVVGQQSLPVRTVVHLAATRRESANSYPGLVPSDVAAALRYAAEVPLIDLNEYDGLGLIVQWPTGVRYSNQTGGGSVHHPELEGMFVPLPDAQRRVTRKLSPHITLPQWRT